MRWKKEPRLLQESPVDGRAPAKALTTDSDSESKRARGLAWSYRALALYGVDRALASYSSLN